MSASLGPVVVRYHCNAIESSILEALAKHEPAPEPRILDIGCGTGHWIDFYSEVFGPSYVRGVDVSSVIVNELEKKYADRENVELQVGDVSREGVDLGGDYDIINAVGVLFHVVEDDKWKLAIRNLASALKPDGILIVGGEFGLVTEDVQHLDHGPNAVLVHKRIRSRRFWRASAREAGCTLVEVVKKKRRPRLLEARETNIGVLMRQ